MTELPSSMAPAVPASGAAAAQTLAQKLIARACGREAVAVGEIVTCKVDLAMFHDSSGPRRLQPMLEQLGRGAGKAHAAVLEHAGPVGDLERLPDVLFHQHHGEAVVVQSSDQREQFFHEPGREAE